MNADTFENAYEDSRGAVMGDPNERNEYDLVLSVRGANLLKRVGVKTVGELVRFTADEILESSCFGETSLREIQEALAKRGLRLGMTVQELRGQVGLDGKIVKQPSGTNTSGAEYHDHDSSCCGHCEQATRALRARTESRATDEVVG